MASITPVQRADAATQAGPKSTPSSTPSPAKAHKAEHLDLPWREAGLSERRAAAHLLDRLAYGPRPGNIDAVVEMGLERWLERQLTHDFSNPELDAKLAGFHSLDLSARDIAKTYPRPSLVLRQAQRAGVVEDAVQLMADEQAMKDGGRSTRDPEQRRKVMAWAGEQGYRPAREAIGELLTQKLARAVYSDNQLQEVLTDFWFNHFNVSITDNQARIYVWPYERDAIRPFVLGKFDQMLEATAKHPAMLHYLDNVRSTAEEGAMTTFDPELLRPRRQREMARRGRRGPAGRNPSIDVPRRPVRADGLNENYARELMELHTLGVDGGYSQEDVEEVARAFSGWSTYPPEGLASKTRRTADRLRRAPEAGFVFEETFLFRADKHDAGAKTVLGHRLAPKRGIEDGLEVLEILAHQPATARHLASKMATRFVADQPPEALVDRLSKIYLESGGDLKAMVIGIVESPEFWSSDALGAKVKSPFALTASALRVTDAGIDDPRALLEWISKMGQPLYAYQAPTGYPDRADAWVNTGALLARMNFGLQLATGRVPGVHLDLPGLEGGQEPDSLGQALEAYVPLLLPERDTAEVVARLAPMAHDPDLADKIARRTDDTPAATSTAMEGGIDSWQTDLFGLESPRGRDRLAGRPKPAVDIDTSPLAQVVGVILGSPDFQRH